MKKKNNLKLIIFLVILIIIALMIIIPYYRTMETDNMSTNEATTSNKKENKLEETNTSDTIQPVEETENELFEKYYAQAEKTLNKMTLEEKIGQMFLVRYPDTGVIEQIEKYAPGGYILFGKDFKGKNKTSILKQINECQKASKINMFFGVDEEGGTVVRVSAYKEFRDSKFKSPQELWSEGQLPKILKDSTEKSKLLKSIGINMNLTPVADVPTKKDSFIYKRSYGRGAEKTAIYVAELIKQMNSDNMISSMKHFPGYGDNADTHTGIAIDKRKYSTFEKSDFLPFASGIKAGGPTILVSHNIVNCMDSKMPASLSKKVHDILREELNFTGIILTDDLAMDAVKTYVENGEASVQAVLAGNDMIISSDFITQRNEILKAVKNNKISEDIIDNAVRRILACKYMYHI